MDASLLCLLVDCRVLCVWAHLRQRWEVRRWIHYVWSGTEVMVMPSCSLRTTTWWRPLSMHWLISTSTVRSCVWRKPRDAPLERGMDLMAMPLSRRKLQPIMLTEVSLRLLSVVYTQPKINVCCKWHHARRFQGFIEFLADNYLWVMNASEVLIVYVTKLTVVYHM